MRNFILAIFLALTLSPKVHAARIAFVGVANSSEPHQPGNEYTAETGLGAGVLLEFRLLPLFGFELGALYAPRKFSHATLSPSDAKITYTANMYQFPVLFRAHLGRTFSLGVGAYYAKAKGDLTVESVTNSGKSSQKATFASQGLSDSDYGLASSVAISFRLLPLTYLLLDGRYLMGLKNNSTVVGGDRKYNDMQLLAGLQFGF